MTNPQLPCPFPSESLYYPFYQHVFSVSDWNTATDLNLKIFFVPSNLEVWVLKTARNRGLRIINTYVPNFALFSKMIIIHRQWQWLPRSQKPSKCEERKTVSLLITLAVLEMYAHLCRKENRAILLDLMNVKTFPLWQKWGNSNDNSIRVAWCVLLTCSNKHKANLEWIYFVCIWPSNVK